VAAVAARVGSSAEPAIWRERLALAERHRGSGLGVECDGRLVAYMLGLVHGGQFGLSENTALLEFMGVEPAWQGHGLARALAEALFALLAAQGVERVLTLVSARDEQVQPFFRSLGLRQSQLVCLERRL
jgi:ribosomal protein S18 acetylase RimI-like enzyme